MKQTSANMKPCKINSAERHNRREKELKYIRKEYSNLNVDKEWISIDAQMERIRAAYEQATGQKMQATAQPIQEIVLVIDESTTPAQVERFCTLIKQLGMTPLSYSIHRDEGHTDIASGEWKANHHAHIIVDTTCWEHRTSERTKKKNGKNVIDPKTRKPVKVKVDAYAKTIKFTPADMAKLQDYAAEATGLERGVSSDRIHEDARRYKAHQQAKEIADQAQIISEQKNVLAQQESDIRDCVVEMQQQGLSVVENFDAQVGQMVKYDVSPDPKLMQRRNWLDKTSREDLSRSPISRLLKLVRPLSDAITVVALAATAMASVLADSLAKSVDSLKSQYESIEQQIKALSVWKSFKGTVRTFVGKPADRQAESLLLELSDLKTKNKELSTALIAQTDKASRLESRFAEASSSLRTASNDNSALRSRNYKLNVSLAEKESTLSQWNQDFIEIAERLVDNVSPGTIAKLEKLGVNKVIGENIWDQAKETSAERKVQHTVCVRDVRSRGPHM